MQGAKIPESILCIVVGILMYFAVPRPAALTSDAWALLSIFIATILGKLAWLVPNDTDDNSRSCLGQYTGDACRCRDLTWRGAAAAWLH
jgi:accessory gene regulator protein AgrB